MFLSSFFPAAMSLEFSPSSINSNDDNSADDTFCDIKKELIFDTPVFRQGSSKGHHPIEVFLRVRPQPPQPLGTAKSFLTIKNDSVCTAVPPCYSKWSSKASNGEQFMFSMIFKKDSTQKEVFKTAVVPVLEEFFKGQNTLLLAYGVTNSGKTYTMTG